MARKMTFVAVAAACLLLCSCESGDAPRYVSETRTTVTRRPPPRRLAPAEFRASYDADVTSREGDTSPERYNR